MSSKSETFLVTGANGFIGSHLAQHLHRKGEHVLAGVRNLERRILSFARNRSCKA